VDAVIDQQGNAEGLQRRAQRPRLLDHCPGRTMLVAQLHQCCTVRDPLRQVDQRAAAGNGRVDERIEPEVDSHQLTFRRAASARPSRLCSVSTIATAKLPGPAEPPPAISPATPTIASAATAARNASGSTARQAATRAEPAQPMAVIFAISG